MLTPFWNRNSGLKIKSRKKQHNAKKAKTHSYKAKHKKHFRITEWKDGKNPTSSIQIHLLLSSEVTTLWRYTYHFIIIVIIIT